MAAGANGAAGAAGDGWIRDRREWPAHGPRRPALTWQNHQAPGPSATQGGSSAPPWVVPSNPRKPGQFNLPAAGRRVILVEAARLLEMCLIFGRDGDDRPPIALKRVWVPTWSMSRRM